MLKYHVPLSVSIVSDDNDVVVALVPGSVGVPAHNVLYPAMPLPVPSAPVHDTVMMVLADHVPTVCVEHDRPEIVGLLLSI